MNHTLQQVFGRKNTKFGATWYKMEYSSNTSSCIQLSHHSVSCHGVEYFLPEEPLTAQHQMFWLYLIGYISVVLFAGMMSGLTLAIFSLDLTSLKVLEMAGSEKDKIYASRITPLARRQYLVLVSLVLANSLAVEAMPLLLDRISTPVIAIAVSVSGVLIFGEVLPQAVCGSHGLIIGYYFSWLVWAIIAVLFVVAWPLSKILEAILGKNRGTFYRRAELKALVDLHGPETSSPKKRKPRKRSDLLNQSSVAEKELPPKAVLEEAQRIAAERLTIDEVLIIRGALELSAKTAEHAMIKLEDVYMLSLEDNIDSDKLQEILDEGHSRIPLYIEYNRESIHGVLLTKRLITVDPTKSHSVRRLTQDLRYFYPPYYVDLKTPLYKVLNTFQEGISTHIGFVTQQNPDGCVKVIGIVTLEDIIEELLMEEILDETDVIRDINHRLQIARACALRSISTSDTSKKSTVSSVPMSRKRQRKSLPILNQSKLSPVPLPPILSDPVITESLANED